MKLVPCEQVITKENAFFKITDSTLVGRKFYVQVSFDGKDWCNIPWGTHDSDDDNEDDAIIDNEKYDEWSIDDVPTIVAFSAIAYEYIRLVIKEEGKE